MKRSGKVLSFLTAAAMLGGVAVPAEPLAQLGAVMMVGAADATSGTCGENLTWKYDASTKTLTISGTGEMENYADPKYVPWYSYVDEIVSLNMEDGIKSVGECAFAWCSSLTSVTIPDSVTNIGADAFHSCSSLTSVTIPDSMTNFGSGAFLDTPWLENQLALAPYAVVNHVVIDSNYETCSGDLVLPKDVTSIGDGAFYGCELLTSVTIPGSVTSIGKWAFEGCYSLTAVTISDGVTSIGNDAFYYCNSLTDVTIPDSVTSIGKGVFYECSNLTSVTIPDGVTSIGDFTFAFCGSLTSVTIPDSVTSIGGSAFCMCSSLTSVKIPNNVKSIGDDAFCGAGFVSVTIPDSVTSIGDSAFSCVSLNSIIIENPDCEIYDDSDTIDTIDSADFTIYGYDNSTAQAYAEKYGRTFKSLGPAPERPADTLGDVSGDNVIDAGDAAMTLSAAASYGATGKYGSLTDTQIAAADIDGSGNVNASDAAYILQYAAMRGANGKDFDIRELVK